MKLHLHGLAVHIRLTHRIDNRTGSEIEMQKSFVAMCAAIALAACGIGAAQARVVVKESTKYYSVSGTNGPRLYNSIRKRGSRGTGARHAIASTRTKMDLKNVKTAVRGRRCVVTDATLVLTITYTYPRWTNAKRASPRTRKAWNRFIARVKRHELKHGQIAKSYARKIERRVRTQKRSTRDGCADRNNRHARGLARDLNNLRKAQLRFDRRESSRFSRIRRLERALATAR